jgi:hypothetical protein
MLENLHVDRFDYDRPVWERYPEMLNETAGLLYYEDSVYRNLGHRYMETVRKSLAKSAKGRLVIGSDEIEGRLIRIPGTHRLFGTVYFIICDYDSVVSLAADAEFLTKNSSIDLFVPSDDWSSYKACGILIGRKFLDSPEINGIIMHELKHLTDRLRLKSGSGLMSKGYQIIQRYRNGEYDIPEEYRQITDKILGDFPYFMDKTEISARLENVKDWIDRYGRHVPGRKTGTEKLLAYILNSCEDYRIYSNIRNTIAGYDDDINDGVKSLIMKKAGPDFERIYGIRLASFGKYNATSFKRLCRLWLDHCDKFMSHSRKILDLANSGNTDK